MPRHVVLLRGVNVGGANRVPMADLRALLEGLGYADVATYVQSGNAVLTADAAPRTVASTVRAAIAAQMGLDVGVAVRTAEEMAAIVAADVLGEAADDPARRLVVFLPGPPDAAAVAAVAARDHGDERLAAAGRELYAWCPGGIGRSPLLRAVGVAGLDREGTARNWRTVTRLAEMAA